MSWFSDKFETVKDRLDTMFPKNERPSIGVIAGCVVGAALTTSVASMVAVEAVAGFAAYKLGKGVWNALSKRDEVEKALRGFDESTRYLAKSFLDKHCNTSVLQKGDKWLVRDLDDQKFSVMDESQFREFEETLASHGRALTTVKVDDKQITMMHKNGEGKLHGVWKEEPAIRVIADGKITDRYFDKGVQREEALGSLYESASPRN